MKSRRAFAEFVNKVPFYGAAILCLDDEHIQQILPAHQSPRDHLRHRAQTMLTITGLDLRTSAPATSVCDSTAKISASSASTSRAPQCPECLCGRRYRDGTRC